MLMIFGAIARYIDTEVQLRKTLTNCPDASLRVYGLAKKSTRSLRRDLLRLLRLNALRSRRIKDAGSRVNRTKNQLTNVGTLISAAYRRDEWGKQRELKRNCRRTVTASFIKYLYSDQIASHPRQSRIKLQPRVSDSFRGRIFR